MEEYLLSMGFLKSDNECYIFRIHVLIWLIYDCKDGFVKLRRKNDLVKGNSKKSIVEITLPVPYKEKEKLRKLIEILS